MVSSAHARKRLLVFADNHHVTAAELTTGEVLSVHQIEPQKTYWRNQSKQRLTAPAVGVAPHAPALMTSCRRLGWRAVARDR